LRQLWQCSQTVMQRGTVVDVAVLCKLCYNDVERSLQLSNTPRMYLSLTSNARQCGLQCCCAQRASSVRMHWASKRCIFQNHVWSAYVAEELAWPVTSQTHPLWYMSVSSSCAVQLWTPIWPCRLTMTGASVWVTGGDDGEFVFRTAVTYGWQLTVHNNIQSHVPYTFIP